MGPGFSDEAWGLGLSPGGGLSDHAAAAAVMKSKKSGNSDESARRRLERETGELRKEVERMKKVIMNDRRLKESYEQEQVVDKLKGDDDV